MVMEASCVLSSSFSFFWGQGSFCDRMGPFRVLGFFFFLFLFFVFGCTFLLLGTIAITSVPLFMFLSINGATHMIDIHRFTLLNVSMQGVRFEYIYIFSSFKNQHETCHYNGVIVVSLCTISVTKIFEGLL